MCLPRNYFCTPPSPNNSVRYCHYKKAPAFKSALRCLSKEKSLSFTYRSPRFKKQFQHQSHILLLNLLSNHTTNIINSKQQIAMNSSNSFAFITCTKYCHAFSHLKSIGAFFCFVNAGHTRFPNIGAQGCDFLTISGSLHC